MAGEGVVDEGLRPHLLRFLEYGGSAGGLVDFKEDIPLAGHHVGLLVDGSENEEYVVADFLHLVDSSRSAGDRLTDDNRLDVRIRGHRQNLGDCGLLLVHELIGVGDVNYPVLTVLGDHLFTCAVLLFSLRDSAGHYADLRHREGGRAQNKNERQCNKYSGKSPHVRISSLVIEFSVSLSPG